MKSYGQFCPIAKAAEIFCERWTALVIRSLAAGAKRYSDIHRGVPLMSATLLSSRLRQLEAEGIIRRRRSRTGQHWTYHLTEAGGEFIPLLGGLGAWGQRWTRRDLVEGELDLGLLIWGLEHSVDPRAFGPGRSVVEIGFTDQPSQKSKVWFVNQGEDCELCVIDPGYGVDLYLSATLCDMTHVYRGDISVEVALQTGRLEAIGPKAMIKALKRWLNLGPLGKIQPVYVAAEKRQSRGG
ncbi:MAG: helix-turn-helix transcriptional regulator [Paracoccaceae bacterium]|nr:helix-turn-helix transcriptional regulator [Paracoccaceae bacterium]